MTFREKIEEEIKIQRPHLNPSSVKTYTSFVLIKDQFKSYIKPARVVQKCKVNNTRRRPSRL